jgi:MOSC domain-containing protein YiiM
LPCFKLGLRLGRDDIIDRFFESDRSGFYLAVTREGDVAAGDPIVVIERDRHGITVADIVALRNGQRDDADLLRRAAVLPALSPGWRDHFLKRLAAVGD